METESVNGRIGACFQNLRKQRRVALVAYIMGGDPTPERSLQLMEILVESGADIIELGSPFSDPMADGLPIQRASERALAGGANHADVISMVAAFRNTCASAPVVVMGYLNTLETMGFAKATRAAKNAGVDGFLVVDMPPEEGGDLLKEMEGNGIDPIFLLAPTTPENRIRKICEVAKGFVYYVSLRGVTGAGNFSLSEVERRLAVIRRHTSLPVGVGFGIKDATAAAAVANHCDAVIVGSAIVSLVERYGDDWRLCREKVSNLLLSMRRAIDEASGFSS